MSDALLRFVRKKRQTSEMFLTSPGIHQQAQWYVRGLNPTTGSLSLSQLLCDVRPMHTRTAVPTSITQPSILRGTVRRYNMSDFALSNNNKRRWWRWTIAPAVRPTRFILSRLLDMRLYGLHLVYDVYKMRLFFFFFFLCSFCSSWYDIYPGECTEGLLLP